MNGRDKNRVRRVANAAGDALAILADKADLLHVRNRPGSGVRPGMDRLMLRVTEASRALSRVLDEVDELTGEGMPF